MCIVLDANQIGDFCKQERPHLQCLMEWINAGGRVISGGLLEQEMFKVLEMRQLVLEWTRRGNLKRIPSVDINSLADKIERKCRSNDPHVLAVVVLGRAQLVATADKRLIDDLRDLSIVGTRRKVYKENAASPNRIDRHIKLLRASGCP